MKDEEGKKQDFQTIAYQPKVWTTGAMHQHRKISAEFPWNWWSLTHRDEELGSVAYHTPYADRKSCMCINHRFSELVMLHLYLGDERKCNLLCCWFLLHLIMTKFDTHLYIEAYGTLLLILKANLKISVTLPLYLRDNYLYKQQ